MSADKIRAANNQLKAMLDKRDYQNPEAKKNIKILKVLTILFRSPSLVSPISMLSRQSS